MILNDEGVAREILAFPTLSRAKMRKTVVSTLLVLPSLLLAQRAPSNPLEYGRDVQPIFTTSCVGCHQGRGAPAGLQLDSPANILRGGDSGKVVVPGNAKES